MAKKKTRKVPTDRGACFEAGGAIQGASASLSCAMSDLHGAGKGHMVWNALSSAKQSLDKVKKDPGAKKLRKRIQSIQTEVRKAEDKDGVIRQNKKRHIGIRLSRLMFATHDFSDAYGRTYCTGPAEFVRITDRKR